jgi:hypothetical protein
MTDIIARLIGILAVASLIGAVCVVVWFDQIVLSIIKNWFDICATLAVVCCIIGSSLWFNAETEIAKVWGGYTWLTGIVFGFILLLRLKRRAQ